MALFPHGPDRTRHIAEVQGDHRSDDLIHCRLNDVRIRIADISRYLQPGLCRGLVTVRFRGLILTE
ncbi:hypothetical protein ECZU08_00130 [Escherichia coli]|nr:hypothetical protein ECZU08_00130 [Escherichia coli]